MADVSVIEIIEPANSFDLLTVDEAKLLLGIPATDTSQDAQLQQQISIYSAVVAEMCNRTFAKEKVVETWREVENGRLFPTHYPIASTNDIESITSGDTILTPDDYELEPASGKLTILPAPGGHWQNAAIVTYTGGFSLPDAAPLPLKQATVLLIREERMFAKQAAVAGIRQLTHKESRVVFFDPNAVLVKQAGGAGSPQHQAIEALLKQYTRFWV
jgi:hypothetical protein